MSFMGRDSVRQARAPAGFAPGCMELGQPWFPHLSNGVIVLSACGAMSGVRASESMVNRPTPWEQQALCWPHSPALERPQYPSCPLFVPALATSTKSWFTASGDFSSLLSTVVLAQKCFVYEDIPCSGWFPLTVSPGSRMGSGSSVPHPGANPEFGVPAPGLGC